MTSVIIPYAPDLNAKNQRLRVHYLLEAGWKADSAIQGLGRSNRTNQAQPPLFRPVTTNIKGEKRFLSTIARRLDSLGALTRGHTGLALTDKEGNLKEDLPPIAQFLNRVLTLRIELQNALFEEFEVRLESKIEEAIAAGSYEVGVETLKADSWLSRHRGVKCSFMLHYRRGLAMPNPYQVCIIRFTYHHRYGRAQMVLLRKS